MKKKIVVVLLVCLLGGTVLAQEQIDWVVEFDHLVHDFGDVMLSDGPLSCEFRMKNISQGPIVIYNVTASCGCTDVKWSKEPLRPGQSTTISTVYTNDGGPYPFWKNITLYVSDVEKPIVLRIKGVAHKQQETLEEMFPVTFGRIGLTDSTFQCGILDVGGNSGYKEPVANLSDSPLRLGFINVSEGLSLSVSPNPIPANETVMLTYTVNSLDGVWGKNSYYATPVVSGRPYKDGLRFEAITKDNFEDLTPAQREKAPVPVVSQSVFSAGKIKVGTVVTADWEFTNSGKSVLKIRKVDFDPERITSYSNVSNVGPGKSGCLSVTLDTTGMPQGEFMEIVMLTTNSPSHPFVNLYITGWID